MSIDLSTRIKPPVRLQELLPHVAKVLRDILGVQITPVLFFEELDGGKRLPAVTDELRDRSTPFFLVSLRGEPETVGLMTDGEYLTITMAAQRTKLEYALGAAIAIAVSRKFGGKIEDDRGFFGPQGEVSNDDMFECLRIRNGPGSATVREASDALLVGIDPRGKGQL